MGLSNDPNHEEVGIEVVERVPKEKIRVIKYCKNVALYDSIPKNIRPVVHCRIGISVSFALEGVLRMSVGYW